MKIVVTRFGIVHYNAICNECDFSAAIQTSECKTTADVLRAVRRHVRKIGHEVIVESGQHTRYVAARS